MKMMHQFLDMVANRARTDVERFSDFLIRFPIAKFGKNLLLAARQIDICLESFHRKKRPGIFVIGPAGSNGKFFIFADSKPGIGRMNMRDENMLPVSSHQHGHSLHFTDDQFVLLRHT